MINIFIVGSKGIPARYGGFETFVENLTKRKESSEIRYFVSCMDNNTNVFKHNNATCFTIPLKRQNPFFRIVNVSKAISWVERYLKENQNVENKNILYILGCRVGLLLKSHRRKLKKLNCSIVCNPDGLEWKRGKWNRFEKRVLLLSEKKLIDNSDYVVCDSLGIKDYVLTKYKKLNDNNTTYIAYGCDVTKSSSSNSDLEHYLSQFNSRSNDYYLMIGRFVPENNYKLVIREFMKSKTSKKLLIMTNSDNSEYLKAIKKELHFEDDSRITFVGTCYDVELVKKIRENAFAYIHGHSVGGTNPSLLEAMGSTKINLLYDVPFNKEVGENECLYFNDENNNLSNLINYVDDNSQTLYSKLKPGDIISKRFKWDSIVKKYESLFEEISKK